MAARATCRCSTVAWSDDGVTRAPPEQVAVAAHGGPRRLTRVNPFLAGWAAAKRTTRNAGPGRPPGAGTWRVVALEAGWLAGQIARPSRSLPAVLVGVTVAALLAPVTPGPVVAGGWRTAIAVSLAMVAAVAAHLLLVRGGRERASASSAAAVGGAVVALLVTGTVVVGHVLSAVLPDGELSAAADGGVSAGLEVDGPLALGAALLLAGVLATRLGDRLRVPGALALLVLGMAVGPDGLGWVSLDAPQLVQSAAVIALVVILYEGGLTTRPRSLRGAVAPGVVLATFGVAVTAGVVAVAGAALLDLPASTAWLLAAVVASTDAAAVFDVLRRTPLPRRLAAILQVESGTNDPVAVLLTIAFLSAADQGGDIATWLGFGVVQLVVGLALGLVIGWLGGWILRHLALESAAFVPVLALAIGALAYGVTALVGGSGFLAVYVAGVTIAARTPQARRELRGFHGALSSSVEVGLFLLLGLLVLPSDLPSVAGAGVIVAGALLLVARPVAVVLSLSPFGFRPRELGAVSWLGMRGAVPIVLATVASSAGSPDAAWLLDVVFFVVLLSALVQGVSAPWLVRRLGLETERALSEVVVDVSPFEGADAEVVEVRLVPDSPLVGRRLAELPPPDGMLVTAIVRGSRLVLPRGGTTLLAGDLLVVAVDGRAGAPQLRRWAGEGQRVTGP